MRLVIHVRRSRTLFDHLLALLALLLWMRLSCALRLAPFVGHRRMACSRAGVSEWTALCVGPDELRLGVTLPTGQSFRWRATPEGFTGVVGSRVYELRETASDVLFRCHPAATDADPAAAALHDYLALSTQLLPLHAHFAERDARFKALLPFLRGARLLRQPPAECLFSFICSSNNHVKRIHGMVERLCAAYGTRLDAGESDGAAPFYAFPTVSQLANAEEDALRALGFGYRAKFIVGAAKALSEKPGGGDAWLASLRAPDTHGSAAVHELCALPGVGPKVGACVALFSLDKHATVPVDTHVWQLAVAHYTPELAEASLTPKTMAAVESALQGVFGPYAGWAHTALFVAELQAKGLPDHLRTPTGLAPGAAARKRKAERLAKLTVKRALESPAV